MKVVKGKYIRLTQDQLNSLIKEAVKREVSLVNEYAVKRKDFKFKVWSYLNQILQNWCLIRYRLLTNDETTKSHWKNELSGYLCDLSLDTIKGNNSYESRLKAIMEVFEETEIIDNIANIKKRVIKKFVSENIEPNGEVFEQVINDCNANLINVANVIANGNVDEYIETL